MKLFRDLILFHVGIEQSSHLQLDDLALVVFVLDGALVSFLARQVTLL